MVLAAGATLASCSSGGQGGPSYGPQPAYLCGATDEAWRTFRDAEIAGRVQVGDATGPAFLVPAQGQVVSAGNGPIAFKWNPTPTSVQADPGCRPPQPLLEAGGADAARSDTGVRDGGAPDGWFDEAGIHHPRRLPHYHEAPVTGDVYYLRYGIPGQSHTFDYLQTDDTMTPDPTLWAAFVDAGGQPITVSIEHAYFMEGTIVQGPFAPATQRSFTVQ